MSEKLPFETIIVTKDRDNDLRVILGYSLAVSKEEALGLHMGNVPIGQSVEKTHSAPISDALIEQFYNNLLERRAAAASKDAYRE